jgi:hypothetical protein
VPGSGKRLFGEDFDPVTLRLTDARTVGAGVLIRTHVPARASVLPARASRGQARPPRWLAARVVAPGWWLAAGVRLPVSYG